MKKILITFVNDKVNEGGQSRNKAFYNYFLKNGYKIKNLKISNNPFSRLVTLIRFFYILLFIKDSKMLVHGNLIVSFTLLNKIRNPLYINFVKKLIQFAANNNNITFEINDLRYEQAKDLELETYSHELIELENTILFKINGLKYIFASNCMGQYAIEKYNLNPDDVVIVINGGEPLKGMFKDSAKYVNQKEINFVYAGTLNKGRQIEEVIEIFRAIKSVNLLLLGTSGEWLTECDLGSNIKYLGDFEETKAQEIVSMCDVGIIPYDSSRFYYNISYPTKASFYLTAGVPILSTELNELKNVIGALGEDIAVFSSLESWGNLISNITKEDITEMKSKVAEVKNDFEWESLLKRLKI